MTTATETPTPALTRKDFASPVAIRWCPGCGDYSILTAVQGVLPTLGIPKEKFVFVSGIGCSSRFPYYMNTYGFHTIHGRAPAVATGVKVANPDLQVWVITGDGDSLSIGGNHFIHALRRNVDLKIILFNNRIYGLTKGQYSPTSLTGHKTKSTPFGSIDNPLSPLCYAIGSEATFVARSVDVDIKHLTMVLERAAVALALHRMIERDRTGLHHQAQSGLIDDVLRGRVTDEREAAARAHALGLRSAARYTPVVVRVDRTASTSETRTS